MAKKDKRAPLLRSGLDEIVILSICVSLTSREHRVDFERLLARGLNTWDGAPRWLLKLYDKLKLDNAVFAEKKTPGSRAATGG